MDYILDTLTYTTVQKSGVSTSFNVFKKKKSLILTKAAFI